MGSRSLGPLGAANPAGPDGVPKSRPIVGAAKPAGPDGVPKSRPIVGAAKGLTTALGDMLSDILEPMTRIEDEDDVEALGTEELLRNIQEANERLKDKEPGKVAVGSMDVTALYPSIDQEMSPNYVKEEYFESDFEIEDVDRRSVSLYLALTCGRQELVREGIAHLVARKPGALREMDVH